jgi:hypothetical protein
LLLALVDAADSTERGSCEAGSVAETVLSDVSEKWVSDAVRTFEERKYLGLVVRPQAGGIVLMISGDGRKAADSLRAQMATAQQPQPKIGY